LQRKEKEEVSPGIAKRRSFDLLSERKGKNPEVTESRVLNVIPGGEKKEGDDL